MNVDLHCHTNLSDGSLPPEELLKLAIERKIDILAITDHDNIDCYSRISSPEGPLTLISGIEFSTTWKNIGIHIVGLNMDLSNPELLKGIEFQSIAREKRAILIDEKLNSKLNVKDAEIYINWIISDVAKKLINNFKKNGKQLFFFNHH